MNATQPTGATADRREGGVMGFVKEGDTLLLEGGGEVTVRLVGKRGYGMFPYTVWNESETVPFDNYDEDGRSENGPEWRVTGVIRKAVRDCEDAWREGLGVDPQYSRVAEDNPMSPIASDSTEASSGGRKYEAASPTSGVSAPRNGATDTPGSGVKYDQGKPDYSLITRAMVEPMIRALMYGEKKYARGNFRSGFNNTRLAAAAMRHIMAYLDREDLDPESSVSHLGHAMAALGMLLDNEATGTSTDGRYAK